MVVVDESRKGAGLAHPHTDLIILPTSCVHVLLQTHQTPGPKKHTDLIYVLKLRYAEVSYCSGIPLIEFTKKSLFYSFFLCIGQICKQTKTHQTLFASFVRTDSLV